MADLDLDDTSLEFLHQGGHVCAEYYDMLSSNAARVRDLAQRHFLNGCEILTNQAVYGNVGFTTRSNDNRPLQDFTWRTTTKRPRTRRNGSGSGNNHGRRLTLVHLQSRIAATLLAQRRGLGRHTGGTGGPGGTFCARHARDNALTECLFSGGNWCMKYQIMSMLLVPLIVTISLRRPLVCEVSNHVNVVGTSYVPCHGQRLPCIRPKSSSLYSRKYSVRYARVFGSISCLAGVLTSQLVIVS